MLVTLFGSWAKIVKLYYSQLENYVKNDDTDSERKQGASLTLFVAPGKRLAILTGNDSKGITI